MTHNISSAIVIISLLFLIIILTIYFYIKRLSHKYLSANAPLDKILHHLRSEEELVKDFQDKAELNLLVLTGGGLRGMVALHVLCYIEQKLGKKSGEIFNFFSGSSTGAISAAALAVKDEASGYKYSAADVLEYYVCDAYKIFSSPWYHKILTLNGLLAPKFTLEGKTAVLKKYFGGLRLSELKGNLLVPVYDIKNNDLAMVKNWHTLDEPENYDYLVRDLINGASSPPMIFPPTAILVDKYVTKLLVDPAILINNPIFSAVLQVRMLFPFKKINIVLIGNGGLESDKFSHNGITKFGAFGLFQYLVNSPSLSTKLSLKMMQQYMQNSKRCDPNLSFTRIYSKTNEAFSTTDTSKRNFEKIKKYSLQVIEEHKDEIDKLISTILTK